MNIICSIVVTLSCFVIQISANNVMKSVNDPKLFLLLPKAYRYIVHLHIRNAENGKIKSCLGSLIKDDWILTAAHCVSNRKPNSINAHFGALQFRLFTRIESVFIHPAYQASLFIHDIALLKIRNPYRTIEPIPSVLNLTVTERKYFHHMVTQFRSDYTPMLFKWHENITSMHTNPILVVTHEIATGNFCQKNDHKSICTQGFDKNVVMAKGDSGTAVIGLFRLKQRYIYFQIGVLSYLKTITHYKRHRDENGKVHDNVLRQDIGFVSSNLFYYIDWVETVIFSHTSRDIPNKPTVGQNRLKPSPLPLNFHRLNLTNAINRKFEFQ